MLLILSIAVFIFIGAISERYSKEIFRISMVVLFLFTMFRSMEMGGSDGRVYGTFFESSAVTVLSKFDWHFWNYENSYQFGWGYALLNSIAKTINGDYFTFQVLNTIVVFGLLNINIRKTNMRYDEKCLLLFIYYCYEFFWYFFGLLRQNIANLIVWYVVLDFIQNKENMEKWKYVEYLILIYIASLFHASAIVILVLFPIYIVFSSFKPTQIKICIVLAISAVIFLWGSGLLSPLTNFVADISGERYEKYIDMSFGGANNVNFFLKYVFILIMTYLNDGETDNSGYINTTLFAILISSVNSDITLRLAEYFAIGYYCGVPQASYNTRFDFRSQKVYIVGMFAVFLTILIRYLSVNGTYIIDYSIWKF